MWGYQAIAAASNKLGISKLGEAVTVSLDNISLISTSPTEVGRFMTIDQLSNQVSHLVHGCTCLLHCHVDHLHLSKCLRHRVVNPILRKKVLKENHSKKQPSGSHEARNLQGTCLASWVASPFPLFASLTSPCLQTLLQGSPWWRWQCEWSPHPFRSVYWRAKI